jgi:transporter family-2 protein
MRSTAGGVLAAFVGGIGGAAQSRVNAALAGRLHDGVAAALVSNLTALLLVSVAVAVAPSARAGLRVVGSRLRQGSLRLWECVGGACGALYVASQGVSAGVLGLAVFTVAVVAGQTGGGLAVDRAGIAPGGSRPVTRTRLLGAAVTVAAVVIAAGGRLRAGTSLALAVLPLLAGVALAVQGAVNGRVQRAAGAVLPAVLLNAAVGTAALLLVFGVTGMVRGWPSGTLPAQPWLYAGGAIGACFTAIGVAVVRRIGVLLLGLAVIAGQLTGATALDLIAPGQAGPPGPAGFIGVALTLIAVAIGLSAGLPLRRR